MIKIDNHGLDDRMIRLPVRTSLRYPSKMFDVSSTDMWNCIELRPALWLDDFDTIHRCYYCRLCQSHLFGSRIEDFHHRCSDER